MSRPSIQVIIPYTQLCELLEASGQIEELRRENDRLEEQLLALRMILHECIEKIGELERAL